MRMSYLYIVLFFVSLNYVLSQENNWTINEKVLTDTLKGVVYSSNSNLQISNVSDSHMDSYGNLWFSSKRWGLINVNKDSYIQYFKSKPEGSNFDVSEVNTIEEYKGIIYFGTDKGIYKYNKDKNNFEPLAKEVFKNLSPYKASVFSILFMDDNTVLVGTKFGLCLIDINSNKLIKKLWNENPIVDGYSTPNHIHKISLDENDSKIIWGVGRAGLFKLNSEDWSKEYFPYSKSKSYGPFYMSDFVQTGDFIYVIHSDSGRLFNGANLLKFNIKNNSWSKVLDTKVSRKSTSVYEPIHSIRKIGQYIIFGNRGNGLRLIDTNNGHIYQSYISNKIFSKKDPVWKDPNRKMDFYYNDANAIIVDKNGYLWGTHHRENIVRTQEPIFISKNKKDFGQIRIGSVFVNGKKYRKEEYIDSLNNKRFICSEYERNFGLSFTIPNSISDSLIYKYKINGSDWNISLSNNIIQINKLNPGNNNLQLAAYNGEELIDETHLTIFTKRKFLEYLWVKIIGLAILLFLILLFYRNSLNKIKREENLKNDFNKKIAEIEMQALRAQMNPHFLFNSLNSIKHYAITKSKIETSDYITDFSQLIRQILNNSTDKIVSLSQELKALNLYLKIEQKRFEKKFIYSISVDSNINEEVFFIPPLLLQPYVENAIWHGIMHKNTDGHISIDISEVDDILEIFIVDNGIGRAAAKELKKKNASFNKKSLGSQITSDRIELIEKIYGIRASIEFVDLVASNGTPSGTKVIIKIPKISRSVIDNLRE